MIATLNTSSIKEFPALSVTSDKEVSTKILLAFSVIDDPAVILTERVCEKDNYFYLILNITIGGLQTSYFSVDYEGRLLNE